MDQEPGDAEQPATQQTLIDEMTPEDWAAARSLREKFDAAQGAR